ncbi:MAG: DUF1616 domain-containing protein [Candidatus Bathyarchaeota archaeon]|nr:DUF1616 domain-containing protein [Candidatus Bathyarchaeota archaeon]
MNILNKLGDRWFIAVMVITFLASVMPSFISPESPLILIFFNYIVGFIYVSFIPGYCLVRLLFPNKKGEIDFIEMIVLSIILSFSIAGLSGLILGLTPVGLNQLSIRIALSLLTFLFAVIALAKSS